MSVSLPPSATNLCLPHALGHRTSIYGRTHVDLNITSLNYMCSANFYLTLTLSKILLMSYINYAQLFGLQKVIIPSHLYYSVP